MLLVRAALLTLLGTLAAGQVTFNTITLNANNQATVSGWNSVAGSCSYYQFVYNWQDGYTVTVTPAGSGDPDLGINPFATRPTVSGDIAWPTTAGLQSSRAGADSITFGLVNTNSVNFAIGNMVYVSVKAFTVGAFTLTISPVGTSSPVPSATTSRSPSPTRSAPSSPAPSMAGFSAAPTAGAIGPITLTTRVRSTIPQGVSHFYRFLLPPELVNSGASLVVSLSVSANDADLFISNQAPVGNTFNSVAQSTAGGSDSLTIGPSSIAYPTTTSYLFMKVSGYSSITATYTLSIASSAATATPTSSPGPSITRQVYAGTSLSGSSSGGTTWFTFAATRTGIDLAVSIQGSVTSVMSQSGTVSLSWMGWRGGLPACYTSGCSFSPTYSASGVTLGTNAPFAMSFTIPSSAIVSTGIFSFALDFPFGVTTTSFTVLVSETIVGTASNTPTRTPSSTATANPFMNFPLYPSLAAGGDSAVGVNQTISLTYGTPSYIRFHPYMFVNFDTSLVYGSWKVAIWPIGGDADLAIGPMPCATCSFSSTASSTRGSLAIDSVNFDVNVNNYNTYVLVRVSAYSNTAMGALVMINRETATDGSVPEVPTKLSTGVIIGIVAAVLVVLVVVAAMIAIVNNKARAARAAGAAQARAATNYENRPTPAPVPTVTVNSNNGNVAVVQPAAAPFTSVVPPPPRPGFGYYISNSFRGRNRPGVNVGGGSSGIAPAQSPNDYGDPSMGRQNSDPKMWNNNASASSLRSGEDPGDPMAVNQATVVPGSQQQMVYVNGVGQPVVFVPTGVGMAPQPGYAGQPAVPVPAGLGGAYGNAGYPLPAMPVMYNTQPVQAPAGQPAPRPSAPGSDEDPAATAPTGGDGGRPGSAAFVPRSMAL